jgi:hypothetical protein
MSDTPAPLPGIEEKDTWRRIDDRRSSGCKDMRFKNLCKECALLWVKSRPNRSPRT